LSDLLANGTPVAIMKVALASSDLPGINNKDAIVEDSRRRKDATNQARGTRIDLFSGKDFQSNSIGK
jgi:hypothetical protein